MNVVLNGEPAEFADGATVESALEALDLPGVFELEIEELIAGLRPAPPDNLPAIGPGALEGLVWATGHFRNGILLTPVTADLVAGVLAGAPMPDWAAAADPLRFAGVPA
jgi:glycine oxidase